MITQERLKELLDYNPDTGVFIWINSYSQHVKDGDVAGTITKNGYRVITLDGKIYRAARLAWLYINGEWPLECDHEDRNRQNDKFYNLRNLTKSENMKNKNQYKSNKSGVTGVGWFKSQKRFRANISTEGKRIALGSFKDLFSAVCARKAAEILYNFHPSHGVSK